MRASGTAPSHADLWLCQTLEGLAYAFPRGFSRGSQAMPCLLALCEAQRTRATPFGPTPAPCDACRVGMERTGVPAWGKGGQTRMGFTPTTRP
jgi:hypothetical protein